MSKTIKLILDTSFLFVPFKFGIDIFDEIKAVMPLPYKLYVMSGTIKELEKIKLDKEKKGRERKIAEMILQMINKYNLEVIESMDYVDDAIINEVRKNPKDYVVATGDEELRKRVLDLKVYGVIYVRSSRYLEFFSPITGLKLKNEKNI